MATAPIPGNEALRQFELDQYLLLDTIPEREYDDLAQLAAAICDVPYAGVTLIDHDRQWFKARVGIPPGDMPRDISFCSHTIAGDEELMQVEDMTQDDRFTDNPLVTGEHHIRFYAGAPLVNMNGYALGSLCVLDTQPRHLSEQQRNSLVALSRITSSLIEQRRAQMEMLMTIAERNELEDKVERLEHDESELAADEVPSPNPLLVAATVLAGAVIGFAVGKGRR